jgi:hypothetical protein
LAVTAGLAELASGALVLHAQLSALAAVPALRIRSACGTILALERLMLKMMPRTDLC